MTYQHGRTTQVSFITTPNDIPDTCDQAHKLVYYKGRIRDRRFLKSRLHPEPHYFGLALIGKSYPDRNSDKGDFFATIEEYRPFREPILAKNENGYYEEIPKAKEGNYWRDGVHPITQAVYSKIVKGAITESVLTSDRESSTNDVTNWLESGVEGSTKQVFTTIYERKKVLRSQAIAIHGDSCMACGFNFGAFYGNYASGYIQIHHTIPISQQDKPRVVDPETELVPLCANCHAVVHRKKENTLSVRELMVMIESARKKE